MPVRVNHEPGSLNWASTSSGTWNSSSPTFGCRPSSGMPRVIACTGPVGTTRTRHPQQEQKETASQEDLHVGARDLLSRPLATLLPDVERCDNGEVGILVVWPVSAQSVSSTSKPISQCTPNRSITCPSEAPHGRFWRSSTTRPPSDKRANQASGRPRLGPEVGSEIARYDIIGDRLTAP